MITLSAYRDKRVAVFGLARSGMAAARALDASGAEVLAWDDSTPARDAAAADGVALRDLYQADFSRISALVLSPGVPLTHPAPHPLVTRARKADCPVIGDMELFQSARAQLGPVTVVGVTGTNGKSTTTALIAHVLRRAGRTVAMGGNIGAPVLDLAPLGEGGIYVLELSSYQLELAPAFHPDVAVLLNISADHIERHGSLAGYVAAKRRLFDNQSPENSAIVGIDDEHSRGVYEDLRRSGKARLTAISVGGEEGDIAVRDGTLFEAGREIGDLKRFARLPGVHNWQNAAAAYAACRAVGLTAGEIFNGFERFEGLAHRMELVATIRGVPFINDSKATNAEAAGRAIDCFERIYWIAGGRAKEGGIESLRESFRRLRHAYLIGEAAPDFAAALDGEVPHTDCRRLDKAVAAAAGDAFGDAENDPVVLFSPACASFDQFSDFEARGEAFRDAVQRLAAGAQVS